jgi:CRISPR-associated protein Cas2
MLIISYDIADTKLRTRFAKYLSKFGFRLQFSVFQIRHSQTFLNNIIIKIEAVFGKEFQETDSIIIFHLSKQCKKYSFGYAKNDNKEVLFVN